MQRHGHDAETSADLAQDTFIRVLARLPAQPESAKYSPCAYLFTVARNLSRNLKRRQRLAPMVHLDDQMKSQIADPAPSVESIIHSRQCLELTLAAMRELPERNRRAFEMHRLGERTITEIGEEIGLSTTRTWAIIHNAYAHIVERTAQSRSAD